MYVHDVTRKAVVMVIDHAGCSTMDDDHVHVHVCSQKCCHHAVEGPKAQLELPVNIVTTMHRCTPVSRKGFLKLCIFCC